MMNDRFEKKMRSKKRRRYIRRRLPLGIVLGIFGGIVGFFAATVTENGIVLPTKETIGVPLTVAGCSFGCVLLLCYVVLRIRLSGDLIRFTEDATLLLEEEVPLLSVFPPLSMSRSREKIFDSFEHPTHETVEALRLFDVNLSFLLEKEPTEEGKAIALVYPEDREDAILTSLSIASGFGFDGKKVVLVDTDMRQSPLGRVFSYEDEGNLQTYLSGEGDKINIHHESMRNISVISAGEPSDNPIPLLQSEKLHVLIKALQKRYDWVLLHTPSVNVYPDGIAVASYVEGTVAVVTANVTKSTPLFEGVRRLLNVNAKLCGAVFFGDSDNRGKEKANGSPLFDEEKDVPDNGEML